jgi:hypothetical protein
MFLFYASAVNNSSHADNDEKSIDSAAAAAKQNVETPATRSNTTTTISTDALPKDLKYVEVPVTLYCTHQIPFMNSVIYNSVKKYIEHEKLIKDTITDTDVQNRLLLSAQAVISSIFDIVVFLHVLKVGVFGQDKDARVCIFFFSIFWVYINFIDMI